MKIVAKEICPICGKAAHFIIKDSATLLRDAICEFCGVSLRTADLSNQLIFLLTEKKSYNTLADCLNDYSKIRVLNLASFGKIHEFMLNLPGYSFGEFFDGVKSGDFKNGIQCIDLQDIPFEDNTFDFVITEDVFEHVVNYEKAFKEIKRVLKPKGRHVFTIPLHEKQKTLSREKLLPVYHIDPLRIKGAFVVTDFGNDIIEILGQYGMKTKKVVAHRFFFPDEITYLNEKKDYEHYLKYRDDLSQAFRYNSVVFISEKPKESIIKKWINL